jgi:hypothetical protein
MKTSKWLVITLAAAVTAGALLTLLSRAANPATTPGPLRGRLLERAKETLGWSDDHIAQIRAAFNSDKDDLTSLFSRLHDARKRLALGRFKRASATEASLWAWIGQGGRGPSGLGG